MLKQPDFGQRLRALRLASGLSQADLAGGTISTGYLSRLESGARPPTARVIAHLSERLGLPLSAFESEQASSLAQVLASVTSASEADLTELLVEALQSDGEQAPALRWQALWLLARMRDTQGRHEDEHALLLELTDLSERLAAPELQARVATRLARCVRILGDIDQARDYAAKAVELTTTLSVSDRVAALHELVSAEAEGGRLAEASAHADDLCKLTETGGGSAYTKALWASATVCIRRGAHTEARDALERALESLDSREDLHLWMRLRLAAASLYLQVTPPQTAQARQRLDEIGPVLDLIGTELHRQQALSLRAHLAYDEGDLATARELCAEAEGMGMWLSFRDRIRLEALQSKLAILDGQAESGVLKLKELAQQAQEQHNVDLAADIWRSVAEILASMRQAQV
ncbi:helix-turn-helix transcriptional regulator [Amycolatopsis sp. NPDC049688]|uniref:helix-turn-helix transcriptional regulator n=1 Tax=Amycolatopsis sp. NPDC049688 TaxID=3154733 RepID=UPI00341200F0